MLRKGFFVVLITVMSLVIVVPTLAAAPADGLVVEGQSVPGISLGSTRAEVLNVYGEPASCQSSGAPGNFAFCSFDAEGGGQVWVLFVGSDGGYASNSPDDIVRNISWTEAVSGWTTTAGVNTTLARNNPDAVIAAYPNAVVKYTSWGQILQIKDYQLGIEINWHLDFYSGHTSISMQISAPSQEPPAREPLTVVTAIDLSASKNKGQRKVVALVQVRNDWQLAAEDANVVAEWHLPDGSIRTVEDLTSSSGYAYFELTNADKGAYTLTVRDVVLADHQFDIDNSVLVASIKLK